MRERRYNNKYSTGISNNKDENVFNKKKQKSIKYTMWRDREFHRESNT